MSLSVNGIVIDSRKLAEEIDQHLDVADPEMAAQCALVTRELLRQRAHELKLPGTGMCGQSALTDDEIAEALFMRDVQVPPPTMQACRAYFMEHPAQFRLGDCVQASHILFALSGARPLSVTQARAQETLNTVLAEPALFEALAQRLSDCPSGRAGGSLGMLLRGHSVPEFDLVLFCGARLGVLPRLINTRYGFHVVRIERRVKGHMPAFESVAERISAELYQQARQRALRHYVALLADNADISGTLKSPHLQ